MAIPGFILSCCFGDLGRQGEQQCVIGKMPLADARGSVAGFAELRS